MLAKLRKFFGIKKESNQESPNMPQSVRRKLANQHLKTKVTYEYPRSTPFRFPVIPDDELVQERKEIRHEKKGEENLTKRSKNNHIEEKESKTPFTPSKVASPIYGYQREINENIYQKPAYQRKQKKRAHHISENNKDHNEDRKTDHDYNLLNQQSVLEETKITSENDPKNNKRISATTVEDDTQKKEKEANRHMYSDYFIPLDLLNDVTGQTRKNVHWMSNQRNLLEQTLAQFNVAAKVVHVTQGPTVTRFEIQPKIGVKVSRIRNLTDDIKMNMAAKDIRMEAPIPGKHTIGIEIPNEEAQTVGLKEIIETEMFQTNTSPLAIGLGVNIEGTPYVTTIDKMPHGLIAGATGSGKSVCIHTILLSLIYKSSYEDVKLLLIDPKMVELAPYNDIPHLVSPVVTDMKAARAALKWAVQEMEDRYRRFVKAGVRDIIRFNQKAEKLQEERIPRIVIVIDELSDLMMTSPQDIEDAICRLAQKARACGIHLLIATQRPSVDVITGLMKANIPTRIAFSVSSQVDSRTIIDVSGAERLLGKGDMLFQANGARQLIRLQGAFVSDEEIEQITDYVKSLAKPNYMFDEEQLLEKMGDDEEVDELFEDVVQFILEHQEVSTSLLQRQFRIGYNRAARLIDTLEAKGMISGHRGSKPREVLFTIDELDQYL